jgi:hypothetical protein
MSPAYRKINKNRPFITLFFTAFLKTDLIILYVEQKGYAIHTRFMTEDLVIHRTTSEFKQ